MKMVVCSCSLVVAVFRQPQTVFPLNLVLSIIQRSSRRACFYGHLLSGPMIITTHPMSTWAFLKPREDFHTYIGKSSSVINCSLWWAYESTSAPCHLPWHGGSASYAYKPQPGQMVRRAKTSHGVLETIKGNDQQTMDMWVFEANFGKTRWLEVKGLGHQVLFLGRNCSMAFAAGLSEHCGRRFRGGNRVFGLCTKWVMVFDAECLLQRHSQLLRVWHHEWRD
jgi:hypothetical protein